MFSIQEKRFISAEIQTLLLNLRHPEMPTEKPIFKLHVDGKESWSFADIEPNHVFDDGKEMGVNPFNEMSRELYDGISINPKICQNCKRWDINRYQADARAYCHILNEIQDDDFGDEGCSNDSIICTGPNFYCAFFEDRDNAKT
ncbi:hypothetical protein KAR91_52060 [Candidatus Pacearchaeota archaeon]|nr:hypothetical protein [Candidatus Pacearchaeota archaeon]